MAASLSPPVHGFAQAFVELHAGPPAEFIAQPGHVGDQQRRVGRRSRARAEPHEVGPTTRTGDQFDHRSHRDGFTRPDIHRASEVTLEQRHQGVGNVVGVEEVAPLRAGGALGDFTRE
jgi:hypothetical protein